MTWHVSGGWLRPRRWRWPASVFGQRRFHGFLIGWAEIVSRKNFLVLPAFLHRLDVGSKGGLQLRVIGVDAQAHGDRIDQLFRGDLQNVAGTLYRQLGHCSIFELSLYGTGTHRLGGFRRGGELPDVDRPQIIGRAMVLRDLLELGYPGRALNGADAEAAAVVGALGVFRKIDCDHNRRAALVMGHEVYDLGPFRRDVEQGGDDVEAVGTDADD